VAREYFLPTIRRHARTIPWGRPGAKAGAFNVRESETSGQTDGQRERERLRDTQTTDMCVCVRELPIEGRDRSKRRRATSFCEAEWGRNPGAREAREHAIGTKGRQRQTDCLSHLDARPKLAAEGAPSEEGIVLPSARWQIHCCRLCVSPNARVAPPLSPPESSRREAEGRHCLSLPPSRLTTISIVPMIHSSVPIHFFAPYCLPSRAHNHWPPSEEPCRPPGGVPSPEIGIPTATLQPQYISPEDSI